MSIYHESVLLNEAIAYLNIQKRKKYIDATLGGGGHTSAILEKGGDVLGIDRDEDALAYVQSRLRIHDLGFTNLENLRLVKGNFKDIDRLAKEHGFEQVAGVLFDLGVSAHQLEVSERGFSFLKAGPLDMRMDRNLLVTAKDLVNGMHKDELVALFREFGEESFANPIAQAIVRERKKKPIETTEELALLIEKVIYKRPGKAHPATRVFQALRIAVNDELDSIAEALRKALFLLGNNGRLVVISFHSLEDRIVKKMFIEFADKGYGTIITEKPIIPTEAEIEKNTKSRSAKLRVFEKYEK